MPYFFQQFNYSNLLDELTHRWKFDAVVGGLIRDSIGSAHLGNWAYSSSGGATATISPSVITTGHNASTGAVLGGYSFTTLLNSMEPFAPSSFTIAVWQKLTTGTAGTNGVQYGLRNDYDSWSSDHAFSLFWYSNIPRYDLSYVNVSTEFNIYDSSATVNQWVMRVMTYDYPTHTFKMYEVTASSVTLKGSYTLSAFVSPGSQAHPWLWFSTNNGATNGETVMFNRVLSLSELSTLYSLLS